ncbi:MAG TPA: FkbM family methyltransferase [Flavipsychrobacter sp.]
MSTADRILRKLKSCKQILLGKGHASFSQYGEDIIILSLLDRLNISDISYLDIGANDPVLGSNTYSFYLRGFSGVLIEPNQALVSRINKLRPKDTCLNIGIGLDNTSAATYYMFEEQYNALNTFSKEEAELRKMQGIPFKKTVQVPLKNVNEIITTHFNQAPTIVTIDVEGLDEQIIRSIDFQAHKPLVLCVETVTYSKTSIAEKKKSLIAYLLDRGYFIYADTYANTIFCDEKVIHKV